MEDAIKQQLDRLKAIKSAFILEAQALVARGLEVYARPLYDRAAQSELTLADLFESQGRRDDADISLLSAGFCLVKARQFQAAAPILERVADVFPEAQQLL